MRYTSLAQLLWILGRGELPLIRMDLFRDRFEGSVSRAGIENEDVLMGGIEHRNRLNASLVSHYPNMNVGPRQSAGQRREEITRIRKALIRSSHASCWRHGHESEGMWRLYCGEKEGVALCTTFGSLEKSIAGEQILAGLVRYVNYETVPAFNDPFDPLMHKREGFDFEREVRLIRIDQNHWNKLCTDHVPELPACHPIPWSLKKTVDRIVISPYADEWYMDAVRSMVDRPDIDLVDRIEWSRLRAEPRL